MERQRSDNSEMKVKIMTVTLQGYYLPFFPNVDVRNIIVVANIPLTAVGPDRVSQVNVALFRLGSYKSN